MTIVSTHPYLRKGLEKGRSQQALYSLMAQAHKLEFLGIPYIHSFLHFAHLTKFPESYLRSVVNRHNASYTSYAIPKRSGGSRYLQIPSDELKGLQRWINCEILNRLPVHSSCYSYHKNSSIVQCAEKHCSSKWLIKLDIENFFDTINEVEVYKVFRKIGYKPLIAFGLARICTYQPISVLQNKKNWVQFNKNSDEMPFQKKHIRHFGRVPQGAPTSPMLSNLVLADLDEKLSSYAQKRGGIYTRYADDLFISFSQNNFDRQQASQVIGSVLGHVKSYGYNLKKSKIKVIPPGSNKVILGLSVNDKQVRLTKQYRQKINSHIYGIVKFGVDKHAIHRGFDSVFGMIDHVFGLINYAKTVEPDFGHTKYQELQDSLRSSGLSYT
ncbi:reverse transcriptase domain-containing protein [Vibrio crassostreae]|uniref:reverse transcriptase domain-containing protein n=1 Tax=Vibrio crassostreae TaxID=246167 RepID=UPI00352BF1DF